MILRAVSFTGCGPGRTCIIIIASPSASRLVIGDTVTDLWWLGCTTVGDTEGRRWMLHLCFGVTCAVRICKAPNNIIAEDTTDKPPPENVDGMSTRGWNAIIVETAETSVDGQAQTTTTVPITMPMAMKTRRRLISVGAPIIDKDKKTCERSNKNNTD